MEAGRIIAMSARNVRSGIYVCKERRGMKKRKKMLDIPVKVKKAVAERDCVDGHPCCIWCGKPAPTSNPLAFSNAHYISRAQGGMGVEENILTLDWKCHLKYDQSEHREVMGRFFRDYLKNKYPGWDENKLIYKK